MSTVFFSLMKFKGWDLGLQRGGEGMGRGALGYCQLCGSRETELSRGPSEAWSEGPGMSRPPPTQLVTVPSPTKPPPDPCIGRSPWSLSLPTLPFSVCFSHRARWDR